MFAICFSDRYCAPACGRSKSRSFWVLLCYRKTVVQREDGQADRFREDLLKWSHSIFEASNHQDR
jgi:hypothetical protein